LYLSNTFAYDLRVDWFDILLMVDFLKRFLFF